MSEPLNVDTHYYGYLFEGQLLGSFLRHAADTAPTDTVVLQTTLTLLIHERYKHIEGTASLRPISDRDF